MSNRKEIDELAFTKVIPSELVDQLSDTADAKDCFVYQRLSNKMQKFMLDYSLRTRSILPKTIGVVSDNGTERLQE